MYIRNTQLAIARNRLGKTSRTRRMFDVTVELIVDLSSGTHRFPRQSQSRVLQRSPAAGFLLRPWFSYLVGDLSSVINIAAVRYIESINRILDSCSTHLSITRDPRATRHSASLRHAPRSARAELIVAGSSEPEDLWGRRSAHPSR